MDDAGIVRWPVAIYGTVLLCCAVSYFILTTALVKANGKDSTLAKALGKDTKGKTSLGIYVVAIAAAFVEPLISCGLYVLVALIWLVPDSRIERVL
jgi:uncharacterized membrane protein